jgi:hypothetical protein
MDTITNATFCERAEVDKYEMKPAAATELQEVVH